MILEELVARKIISKEKKEELEKEIKSTGKREEEVIVEKNIFSEEDLFQLKSVKQGIPLVQVDPDKIGIDLLKIIPEETANFYKIVPLTKRGNILEVGMVWPEDLSAREALNFLAIKHNLEFEVFLITLSDFKKAIKLYRMLEEEEVGKALEALEKELKIEGGEGIVTEALKIAEETPISKAVASILRYGLEGEASDIHIEPHPDKLRVRYRFLGKLYSSIFLPLKIHPAIISRVKILSNLRIDETRVPQDGRFSIEYEGRKIDLRISTFPTALGEKIAIRILDPKMGLKKFDELGLMGKNYEAVKEAIEKPYGMVLVTGPTGSGKTTTLYAILQMLNEEGVNIVTLEDPIEYVIPGINQSQIRPEIGYSFANGLRQILRQDPDIILVGEIRDSETANLAVQAALTGHIVLSTLHTNNAPGAIPRLIDLGVHPFLISPSLNLVIAQRLVRVLCSNCKKAISPSPEIKKLILNEMEKIPEKEKKRFNLASDFQIYTPVGCKECNGKGFVGRIAIFEVLQITKEMGDIISREFSEKKIFEEAKKQGMLTMKQDGILKVLQGITTIEEVIRETG